MLAMSEVNYIKHLRNEKSYSINKIKEILGINWRTAKKYADDNQIPEEKVTKKRGMMYEEKWGEIVSDWLWEDQQLKKKQRRTNVTIYESLKKIGFSGSYRTVCKFVAEWREGKNSEDDHDKSSERLEHPPAEAQLDFGLMEAVKDGNYVDIHCLVMSLPNSNAGFAIPLPGENQECFLYGLKQLFYQLGNVPRKIRIDNLRAAVIKPRGRCKEARFTEEFLQFANFYGFEPQACNPYAGHEKGNVENKVGYVRYNFVTPAPVINNLEHLEQILKERLIKDRERKHYKKLKPIQELLEEERKYHLALPEDDYPIFKEVLAKANKYGEIVMDGVKVHIPKGYNYGQVRVIKYWDKFKVLSPNGEILHTDYRPYMHKKRHIPWISILNSWLHKPRVVRYSRYSPYLPGRIYEYISIDELTIRKERIKWLISLLTHHEMEEINERFYELLSENNVDNEIASHPYEVDWTKYDQLQSAFGGEINE